MRKNESRLVIELFSNKAVNNHEIEWIIQRLHEITRLSADDGRHHLQHDGDAESSGALASAQASYQY